MVQQYLLLLIWLLSFTFFNCNSNFKELDEVIQNVLINNGEMYIGATSKLLKLDSDFNILRSVSTDGEGQNYNQFLLIVPHNASDNLLMACGNSQQGTCQFFTLNTLENKVFQIPPSSLQLASKMLNGTFVGLVIYLGNSKVFLVARTLIKPVDQNFLIRVNKFENSDFFSGYTSQARRSFTLKFRNSDEIDYEYRFISVTYFENYAYFFSAIHSHLNDGISKVIRILITESEFGPYVEKPLQCSKDGRDYKILNSTSVVKLTGQAAKVVQSTEGEYVVFGLFLRNTLSSDSAVCLFHVPKIESSIKKSINEENAVPVASWLCIGNCDGSSILLAPDDVIEGIMLYESNTIVHQTLFAFTHERGITLFLSSQSSVYEFAVFGNSLYKYAEVKFPTTGQHVFNKVVLDQDNLYFSGNGLVARVKIHDCARRKTCLSCLSGPSCGWCTLEKKCSLVNECQDNAKPLRFINKTIEFINVAAEICPSVKKIFPEVVEVTSKVNVNLTVSTIPFDVTYKCSFNGLIIPVKRINSVFVCSSLDMETIPDLKIVDGLSIVKLSLVTEDGLSSVIDSNLTVYMCSSFKMCTKCLTSANACGWCVKDMKCIHEEESCSSKQDLLPHIGTNASYDYKCPQIYDKIMLYSNGSRNDIVLTGQNLLKPEDGVNYQCHFKMLSENDIITIARWKNETEIACVSPELTYQESVSSKTASLSVFMGESAIDVGILSVKIFKCNVGDSDCTTCKNNPKEWNCKWCLAKQDCVTADLCDPISANSSTATSCLSPIISKFYPLEAPIKGTTELSIYGRDLGSNVSEISVKVAGFPCKLNKKFYQVSKKIVCIVDDIKYPDHGAIIVEVNSTAFTRAKSDSDFYFREPTISKISPTVGPCSGQTLITIEGNYLDIGNKAVVKVGGVTCSHVERFPKKILCTSAPGCLQTDSKRKRRDLITTPSVSIEIDGFKIKTPLSVSFKYDTDPLVTQIYTNKESIILETYASGGQVLNVAGQRLEIIKQPQMTFYAYNNHLKKYSNCQFVPKTEMRSMFCLAPNISSAFKKDVTNVTVMLGFVLDGVFNVQNFKNITVFADPVVNVFTDVVKLKTSTLVMSGSGFRVLSKKDVTVLIGESECRVTNIDENLVCEVPPEQELKEKATGDVYPVTVFVGEKGFGLEFNVGFISFYKSTQKETPLVLYIVPAAVALALLFVIVIVLACLYYKKQKRQKEYQALYQVKMDRMESNYARECKEAFAAYQTGVSDLTNDVENVKLPPLDFHQYAMRVLYPGLVNHPILEADKDESEEWKNAMHSFIKLLKEKDFTLAFIKTLESQSSFQMTDRCTVASLLMVTMQDDLRFATSILTMLLVDLIHKAGNGKRPKLLLRRTESVAEKLLTNWLAYTLYDFLEKHVGERLFKLFTAINIHLEKEPIDAITSEAKNSLSEDKFLRQKIEFKTIFLNIEYIDEDVSKRYEGIPVLTCDTITQTKEKIIKYIYKNRPYREWPSADELSLGLASANGALLVLQDEDATNDTSVEWKKLNTLEHYKVPDQTNLRLAPAGITPSPYELGSGTIEVVPSVPTIELTTPKSPSIRPLKSFKRKFNTSLHSITDFERSGLLSTSFQTSHASSPLLHVKDVNEPKLWHMVKPTEYPLEQNTDARHSKTMDQNMVTEVFLTRLLKTKETLQSFVNDLFTSIFGIDNGVRTIPLAVKYLFDFLDKEAKNLDISDNEVHHTWKNNSLPLRFWINIIKNPNFCFDVKKSSTVDSCLSVIAQLFMDSCSPDEHKLGMNSPSNKLLYAKEIPEYKKIVKKFYEDVRNASFNENEFEQSLDQISQKYGKKDSFNALNAASELMMYAVKYKVKIMDSLEDKGLEKLADKLQKIMESIPDD